MKYNKNHKGKSGIYCIKNIVNNKGTFVPKKLKVLNNY